MTPMSPHLSAAPTAPVQAIVSLASATRLLPDWPGKDEGLSARESDILLLMCHGLCNIEIAERLYLSINSVKSYIRTAYRKIEIESRTQAVLWGVEHGYRPDLTGSRDLADAAVS